jgi:hypothetical protein
VLCCCGLLLAACEDRNNTSAAGGGGGVQKPEQKRVTLYLEITGNTSAFNKVDSHGARAGLPRRSPTRKGDVVQAGTTLP